MLLGQAVQPRSAAGDGRGSAAAAPLSVDGGIAELSHAAGLELRAYREDHVRERIRRALERERVTTERELAGVLLRDPEARTRFRRSVAVSVSGLFRDEQQFELLERELLPALLADRRRIQVWSAGCSDGSELYTIALVLERLGALERAFLLGSDVLDENLELARQGVYGEVTIPSAIRRRARFERRDVVREGAPPTRWRLILCRNLAIYLAPAPKRRLHELLAGALVSGGLLMVGRSERIADARAMGLEPAAPHVYRRSP